MLTYHNDPAVKAKYVSRLAAHRAAEHLVQGLGWESNGHTKGCAVGCTLEAYNHALYPVELGLPLWLAYLEDSIFEGLPKGEAEQFAEDFLRSIPVGVDVEPVRFHLTIARMERLLEGLAENREAYADKCRDALNAVIAWCRLELAGDSSAAESAAWSAASAAMSAARSAARSAESAEMSAWSAAWSAESAAMSAWSAAWSAARSTESAAASAERSAESAAWSAESAARSAAESAESAESAVWQREAKTLLALLEACK